MRLKAYFTVEASYIVSFLIFIIGFMLTTTFVLHDNVVNDAAKIRQGIRAKEADLFYYDTVNKKIDKKAIVASPVVGKDDFYSNQKDNIIDNTDIYYRTTRLWRKTKLSSTQPEDVIAHNKNADVLRMGKDLSEILGGVYGN